MCCSNRLLFFFHEIPKFSVIDYKLSVIIGPHFSKVLTVKFLKNALYFMLKVLKNAYKLKVQIKVDHDAIVFIGDMS